MKIKRSKGTGQTSSVDKAKKSGQSSAIDFRHLLQSQMQEVHDISDTSQIAPVQERQQVDPELRMQGVQLTETAIASLESFAAALEDANLQVKDLEPFITALEEENLGLLDIKEQLPKDDPLAKLIEQVAAATYMETAKYRRGDYDS